jgi:hypothetical protein
MNIAHSMSFQILFQQLVQAALLSKINTAFLDSLKRKIFYFSILLTSKMLFFFLLSLTLVNTSISFCKAECI